MKNHPERCGLIPEENPPEFFAKHFSAYHFARDAAVNRGVLEVGFGDGYGMNFLGEVAREVIGIDIAPRNIPLAREKYPRENLVFIHYDGLRFPIEDGTMDLVLSFQVIEHIPEENLIGWLSEIRRVLSKQGVFYVSTLNLKNAQKPGNPYEKHPGHEKEFTAEELQSLLRQVFPEVRLFGLRYTLKHRFFKRLKKWGLENLPPVRSHFRKTSCRDFVVREHDPDGSIDLIAVCRP